MLVQQLAESKSSCIGEQGISLVCNCMKKKNWIEEGVSEPEDMVLHCFLLFWFCTAGFR